MHQIRHPGRRADEPTTAPDNASAELDARLDDLWEDFCDRAVNGTVTHDESLELISEHFAGVQESWWDELTAEPDGTFSFDELMRVVRRVLTETEGEAAAAGGSGGAAGPHRLLSRSAGSLLVNEASTRVPERTSSTPDGRSGDGGRRVRVSPFGFIVAKMRTLLGAPVVLEEDHDRPEYGVHSLDDDAASEEASSTSRSFDGDSRRNAGDDPRVSGFPRERITYEVDWSCSWRPRELLLAVSALLMLAVCVATVAIVTSMWISSTEALERERVRSFGFTFSALASSFEAAFLARHGEGMEEVANDVGSRIEAMHVAAVAAKGASLRTAARVAQSLLVCAQQQQMASRDATLAAQAAVFAAWGSTRPQSRNATLPLGRVAVPWASSLTAARIDSGLTKRELRQAGGDLVADSQRRTVLLGPTRVVLGFPARALIGNLSEVGVWSAGPSSGGRLSAVAEASRAAISIAAKMSHIDAVAAVDATWGSCDAALDSCAGAAAHATVLAAHASLPELSSPQRAIELLRCADARFADRDACARWAALAAMGPQLIGEASSSSTLQVVLRALDDVIVSLSNNGSSGSGNEKLLRVELAALRRQLPHLVHTTARGDGATLTAAVTAPRTDVPMHSVVAYRSASEHVAAARRSLVALIDHLNWAFVRSTELVVGGFNKTTGEAVAQMTRFRFLDGCYAACERFDPSTRNFRAALADHASGWSLTPDYRPEPIIGAYRWLGSGLSLVFYIERDVIEIRRTGFNFLLKIADAVNRGLSGSSEIEFVERVGSPRMPYFFSRDPCPIGTDCVVLESFSPLLATVPKGDGEHVVFQYGCQHCLRVDEGAISAQVQRLTRAKKDANDHHSAPVTPTPCPAVSDLAGTCAGLDAQTTQAQQRPQYERALNGVVGAIRGTDYAGTDVLMYTSSIANYSVGLVFKLDRDEFLAPIVRQVGFALATTVCFIAIGVGVVLVSSSSALSNVENEWQQREQQIDTTRKRFLKLTSATLPRRAHDFLLRGMSFVAEPTPAVGFACVNACGFNELIRPYNHRHVTRLVMYMDIVLSEIAERCGVMRLRMLGDIFWVVAMRERWAEDTHQTRRIARFAVAAVDLFSPNYEHRPQQAPQLRPFFADYHRTTKSLLVPRLRCGAHFGPAVFGCAATAEGRTTCDVHGASLALTTRMCNYAEPLRIMVSAAFKDALVQNDPRDHFTFDPPRKMNVRIPGTTSGLMYHIRSSRLPIMKDVMGACGICETLASLSLNPETLRQQGLLVGMLGTGSYSGGGSHSSTSGSVGKGPAGRNHEGRRNSSQRHKGTSLHPNPRAW